MTTQQHGPPSDEERFTRIWTANLTRVLGYARRHVDHHSAQEVAAETFLVAWRRLDEVPDDALAWLLAVARRVVANQHRGERRRSALAQRVLGDRTAPTATYLPDEALSPELRTALASLTLGEREALLLTAWDGLTPREAAVVLGCSVSAVHVRLHRARRRLTGPDQLVPTPPAVSTGRA